jgi:signal peptidase complex subunit 2
VGTHKTTGEKIEISTRTEKHKPIYNVTVKTTSKDGKVKEVKLKKGFNGWFDKKGGFVVLPFQQMFASAVDVIGKADPAKVVSKEKKKKVEGGEAENKSMEDKWASLLAESSGITLDDLDTSSSTATPSKGGKKRGKKA